MLGFLKSSLTYEFLSSVVKCSLFFLASSQQTILFILVSCRIAFSRARTKRAIDTRTWCYKTDMKVKVQLPLLGVCNTLKHYTKGTEASIFFTVCVGIIYLPFRIPKCC